MSEFDSVDVKGKKWEFNEEVAKCFDDMLSRSIPEYSMMRYLTHRIGKRYVQPGQEIVDIGCSNGNAIESFVTSFGAQNRYRLYDVSKPMLENCKKKFDSWIKLGLLDIEDKDITRGLTKHSATLALSILTLQFTPIEYRQRIVQDIYDNLIHGGAFILVEKVLGNTEEIDSALVSEYYKMKSDNAYTEKQIHDKRKSLEGVLVPITASWNEDLLKQCGFHKIDCFWRCLNFAGWIAIK